MKSIVLFFILCTFYSCSDCSNEGDLRQWTHYPQQTQGASSRDSYVKAAEHATSIKGADLGAIAVGGIDSSNYYYPAGDSSAYYYHIHPNTKPKYYGYGHSLTNKQSLTGNIVEGIENSLDGNFFERPDEAIPKTDPVSIAGLGSLVVSSLSGLSWVAIAALALILGPVLVPLVIAPLIFLGIILYFIPVIKLDLPADNSRSSNVNRAINVIKHLEGTARFVQQVAENEECIERISCEIAKMARGNLFENWINKKLESYKNKWLHKVSRSFKTAINGSDCRIYSCNPNVHLKKVAQSLGSRT